MSGVRIPLRPFLRATPACFRGRSSRCSRRRPERMTRSVRWCCHRWRSVLAALGRPRVRRGFPRTRGASGSRRRAAAARVMVAKPYASATADSAAAVPDRAMGCGPGFRRSSAPATSIVSDSDHEHGPGAVRLSAQRHPEPRPSRCILAKQIPGTKGDHHLHAEPAGRAACTRMTSRFFASLVDAGVVRDAPSSSRARSSMSSAQRAAEHFKPALRRVRRREGVRRPAGHQAGRTP